ncbi:MAG: S8 family serine peptidase, partial [Deltaproteobacteria bacterium]|nr:S8 family serine peptidase [Deltaproteobacteria bacterium]
YPLIAGASGNFGYDSVPYNKGYNMICVGGSNDQGDSSRSNDTLYSDTSSKNPDTLHDDRELPMMVAPAVNVTAAGVTGSGTSAAAPQVAAAAAQMQYNNSSLKYWPEVQRAILMATADENVDGPVLNLNDTTDDRDGAGEMNIELAMSMSGSSYKVNGGNTPVQAGFDYGTMTFSSDFTNNYYNEVYYARYPFSGQRMRVVLAWDSTASCTDASDPSSCTSDTLDADLDIYVSTGGRWVATSASWDNSYEFVEFDVQPNVTYEIRVYKSSSTATSTFFGLAWNTWTYGP